MAHCLCCRFPHFRNVVEPHLFRFNPIHKLCLLPSVGSIHAGRLWLWVCGISCMSVESYGTAFASHLARAWDMWICVRFCLGWRQTLLNLGKQFPTSGVCVAMGFSQTPPCTSICPDDNERPPPVVLDEALKFDLRRRGQCWRCGIPSCSSGLGFFLFSSFCLVAYAAFFVRMFHLYDDATPGSTGNIPVMLQGCP
jgi:hypothetical protein